MKEILFLFVLGSFLLECDSREPMKPVDGAISFMVYFSSRNRGLCVGTLVSRMAVLTAAVCVINVNGPYDTSPINVVTGSHYRHAMRGIKVQVTTIIIPKLPEEMGTRSYLLQKSAALLLLRRKVPDLLTEVPLRALAVDWKGEDPVDFQDECIVVGWHFFFYGIDKIYPGPRFILQRNLRFQQMVVASKDVYCGTLVLKYEQATDALGNNKQFMKNDVMCLRDPDFVAQPCHGEYGAPVICGAGRMVGMLMAPDAQWTNCTGSSVLTHKLNNRRNQQFFECVNRLFDPEVRVNWAQIRINYNNEYSEGEEVVKSFYDGVITDFSSSTEEVAY